MNQTVYTESASIILPPTIKTSLIDIFFVWSFIVPEWLKLQFWPLLQGENIWGNLPDTQEKVLKANPALFARIFACSFCAKLS